MKGSIREVIVNADDFGYSPGVTAGILYAHHHGIVTSTTIMANCSFAEEASILAMDSPRLGIGLHLTLDMGKPILSHRNSLTDANGFFKKGKHLRESAKKDDIQAELEAQLLLLFKWGVNVTHIDSHHHMHHHIPEAFEAVAEISEKYKLPVRSIYKNDVPAEVVTNQHFSQDFYGEGNITVDSLIGILDDLKSGVTEIMTHPAFIDPWVYYSSSYNLSRMLELQTLTDQTVKKRIKKEEIHLINYDYLKETNNNRK